MQIKRIAGALGAEIAGLDLRQPLDDTQAAALRDAFHRHKVIFLREQPLDPAQFLAFARRLGEPIEYPFVKGLDGFPEIIEVKKLEHEKVNFGGVWHSDTTGDASERVDFDVLLDYAGSKRRMRNGVEEQLHGVDSTALRLVKLPKLDQPVYCVPTPLTLFTPIFDSDSKRHGVYTGELKVELRVPTARP